MKNGFQTQNNNVNPTAEQIKRRNKLHKEATKQADKSFSAACLATSTKFFHFYHQSTTTIAHIWNINK
jgi:hypothetical protein